MNPNGDAGGGGGGSGPESLAALLKRAIVHEYHPEVRCDEGERIVDRIRSVDQGTKNTGVVGLVWIAPTDDHCAALMLERARLQEDYEQFTRPALSAQDEERDEHARLRLERNIRKLTLRIRGRVVMEHAAVLNFHGPNNEYDSGTVGVNMFKVLSSEEMQWLWWPAGPVACERAVDHVLDRSARPMNLWMYVQLMQMVFDRMNARLLIDDPRLQALLPESDLWETPLEWCPRAGCMKTGLEAFREEERKIQTMIVGPQQMREEGDESAAEWTESIRPKNKRTGKPLEERKPAEDVFDAYLQGHRLLMDRIEERRLAAGRVHREERRVEREADAERKAAERVIREAEAERKRQRRDATASAAPKKKRKRDEKESAATGKERPRKRHKKQQPPPPPTLIDLVDLEEGNGQ